MSGAAPDENYPRRPARTETEAYLLANAVGFKHPASVNWIVSISEEERRRGALTDLSCRQAVRAFHEAGVLLLRGVFDRALIEEMHRDYVSRFGDLDAAGMRQLSQKPPPNRFLYVGTQRYELTLDIDGRLGDPAVYGSEMIRQVLGPLLGASMQINSFTTVVSHPGAALQHIHSDAGPLFPEHTVGAILPPYAVNMAIPLIDVSLEVGPTGFWPGSHRWKQNLRPDPATIVAEPLARGDCLLLDYRTWHAGLPNCSAMARPILYIVYSRPWFADGGNHRNRNPVNISLADYAALPERLRDLLARGYMQATRSADAHHPES